MQHAWGGKHNHGTGVVDVRSVKRLQGNNKAHNIIAQLCVNNFVGLKLVFILILTLPIMM